MCNLAAHDSSARVLLNETKHIGWTINLNTYPDWVGVDYVAQAAIHMKPGTNTMQITNSNHKKEGLDEMLDAYAWLRVRMCSHTSALKNLAGWQVYIFLNSLPQCQRIHWEKDKMHSALRTNFWPPDKVYQEPMDRIRK